MTRIKTQDPGAASKSKLNQEVNQFLKQVKRQLDPDAITLYLIFDHISHPILHTSFGFCDGSSLNNNLHSWKGLIWRVIQKRDLVSLPNIWSETSALVRVFHFQQERFISYHGMPLIHRGKMIGVLELFHRQEFYADQAWIRLFRTLVDQGAIRIKKHSTGKI